MIKKISEIYRKTKECNVNIVDALLEAYEVGYKEGRLSLLDNPYLYKAERKQWLGKKVQRQQVVIGKNGQD